MSKKKLVIAVFILVAIMQLYVPAKMIIDREDVLATGKEFKFKMAPVDPNDPFRGKYITLRYKEDRVQLQSENDWKRNEVIYVLLSTDKDGYATIRSVSKIKPAGDQDFVKAKVDYFMNDENKNLIIAYPFDRFYMEESKAPAVEKVYNESLRDTTQVAYALVNIKQGDAVIKDVLINGIPLQEIVKINNGNRK